MGKVARQAAEDQRSANWEGSPQRTWSDTGVGGQSGIRHSSQGQLGRGVGQSRQWLWPRCTPGDQSRQGQACSRRHPYTLPPWTPTLANSEISTLGLGPEQAGSSLATR